MNNDTGESRPPGPWPTYCCAVLRDERGRYLLERRPTDAAHAPGQLTCFGGAREAGEAPERCIARELREELGVHAPPLRLSLRLIGDAGVIAWFYAGELPSHTPLTPEPGRSAVWVSEQTIDSAPLSAWHAAALRALRNGLDVARADGRA